MSSKVQKRSERLYPIQAVMAQAIAQDILAAYDRMHVVIGSSGRANRAGSDGKFPDVINNIEVFELIPGRCVQQDCFGSRTPNPRYTPVPTDWRRIATIYLDDVNVHTIGAYDYDDRESRPDAYFDYADPDVFEKIVANLDAMSRHAHIYYPDRPILTPYEYLAENPRKRKHGHDCTTNQAAAEANPAGGTDQAVQA